MIKEFRDFILRGNLVELAVAVVIGTAFAAVGGQQDFSDLTFTINGSEFRYGHFLNALVTFLTIAAVVFFLVIKPINALMERRQVETPVDEQTRDCPECRSDIPVLANRCAFCTAEVGRADAPG